MLGIFLVFFCPAASGPYSVTNGPATAFRALEAAQALFAGMSASLLVGAILCILRMESLPLSIAAVSYDPELFTFRC
jgi:hypothetical protein